MGCTSLGLFKLHMYRFDIKYEANFGYMNTDSLIILIETEDVYKDTEKTQYI